MGAATLFALVFLALVLAGRASPAAGSERTGSIAFEAASGLYVVDAKGGEPRQIPGTKPGDGNPRWSPDGRRLSFDRKRNGNWDVYVMNADGSGVRRVTFSGTDDDFAEWAPNGRWLAFNSHRDGALRAVYAISLVTGAAWRVTLEGQFPDWTPDGRIIFTRPHDQTGALFTVGHYGSGRRPLPAQPGHALGARVSDDGSKIVYVTRTFDIYSALADGTGATQLAASSQDENDPVWSPGGDWIAFDKGNDSEGRTDVYVMRSDGSEETRLTFLGSACCPDWSAGSQ